MVKVIMHGCNGHMGRVITELAEFDNDIEIVAGVDANTEVANDYPVFSSINECDVEADVIIDFSIAPATEKSMMTSASTSHSLIEENTG